MNVSHFKRGVSLSSRMYKAHKSHLWDDEADISIVGIFFIASGIVGFYDLYNVNIALPAARHMGPIAHGIFAGFMLVFGVWTLIKQWKKGKHSLSNDLDILFIWLTTGIFFFRGVILLVTTHSYWGVISVIFSIVFYIVVAKKRLQKPK